jgi:molybdate transport system substrate-binding protein
VFASADEANLAKVGDAAVDPQVFARNRLAIVVEPGNPKGITGLADLAAPGLAVVLCAPEVPCGRLAAAALQVAGVELQPASLEENVKGVLAKVTLGEADAGLVYVTDAQAAGDDAEAVPLDALGPELDTAYPISVLADAADPELARDFVAFVRGAEAQRTLRSFGFLAP